VTKLPAKRKRERSGIERAPRRDWRRHRRFVAGHDCAVTATTKGACSGQVRAHHMRSAANAGTGLKPHDAYVVPLCDGHHHQFHVAGAGTFAKAWRIDLWAVAREFALHSPVPEVKAFAREHWSEETE